MASNIGSVVRVVNPHRLDVREKTRLEQHVISLGMLLRAVVSTISIFVIPGERACQSWKDAEAVHDCTQHTMQYIAGLDLSKMQYLRVHQRHLHRHPVTFAEPETVERGYSDPDICHRSRSCPRIQQLPGRPAKPVAPNFALQRLVPHGESKLVDNWTVAQEDLVQRTQPACPTD
jgi:hypothetical protein